MTDSTHYHRKAAETPDIMDRGPHIDEALHWHNLALDAAGHKDGQLNDNRDQSGSEATG